MAPGDDDISLPAAKKKGAASGPSAGAGHDPAALARTSWGRIWLLVFVGVAVAFQFGKVPPVLSELRAAFGLDLVAAGWLISIFSMFGVTVGIAGGVLADRIGHRRLLLIGLALSAAGTVTGIMAGNVFWLFASRITEGAGFLICVVTAPVLLLACSAPRHRRLVFGLWAAYMPIGLALSMAIAGPLVAIAGWRAVWVVSALLLAVIFVVVAIGVPASGASGGQASGAGGQGGARRRGSFFGLLFRVLREPAPVLIAATFGLYAFQFMSVMGFLPYWLIEQRGYNASAAAVMAAFAVIANALGNMLGSWALDRGMGIGPLIATSSGVMAMAALIIYPGAMPDVIRYGAVILLSIAGGSIPAALFTAVPLAAPDNETIGTANGLLVQGSHTGQIFGPPALAAWVGWAGGWTYAPVLLITAAAAVAACGLAAGRHINRSPRNLRSAP